VTADASLGQAPGATMYLQPSVSWPKEMTVGRRHLVAVNLALVTPDGDPAPWPLPTQEECVYTCALDGGSDFDLWAVHDAAIVLHRFGGSYGPAEFVVTPREKPGRRSLWLTVINQWGVPIGDHDLPVSVSLPKDRADPGEEDEAALKDETLVEAGVAAGTEDPPGDTSPNDLRIPAADQDYPLAGGDSAAGPVRTDLPGTPRPEVAGLTRQDFAYADAGDAATEDLLAGLWGPADLAPYSEPAAPDEPGEERPPLRLAEWYNVVGLRRSASGNLHQDLYRLFDPGTAPGERVTFTARCAPADEHGTVFAVVAELPNGAVPQLRLRSVQSARIPPGNYEVTAELLYPGPGHVRFHGLPTMPRDEPRLWPQIMDAVPRHLGGGAGPAHLIAAIEISGQEELVADRIDCVRRLFAHVAAEAESPMSYSVLTYGPHTINVHNRDYPEVPVTTLAWADTSDAALSELARLSRRPVAPEAYRAAAQVECVLTELNSRLTGHEGRPVIVTAGVRTAHPPTVDASRIIPCIYRNDWRIPMENLRARHAGIAFGAIHDTGIPDELWRFLGNDIGVALEDFSASDFALALGLTAGYAQFLPLPLIDGLPAVGSPA
jgi:hypothetical protein